VDGHKIVRHYVVAIESGSQNPQRNPITNPDLYKQANIAVPMYMCYNRFMPAVNRDLARMGRKTLSLYKVCDETPPIRPVPDPHAGVSQ
jgi:hypothetical protein